MTKEEFKESINVILEYTTKEKIALYYDISVSTVRRRANGTSCPLPRMRKIIINELGYGSQDNYNNSF